MAQYIKKLENIKGPHSHSEVQGATYSKSRKYWN